MESTRLWVISPNAQNDGNVNYWLEKSKTENKVFVGYDSGTKHGDTFDNTIKINDCVIIAQGSKDSRRLFLAGIVNSEMMYDVENEINYRNIDYLLNEKDFIDNQIKITSENAYGESNNPGTIYELKEYNPFDKNVIEKIKKLIMDKLNTKQILERIELLEYKKQIILQGPPGTGKTRLAKEIAKEMTKPKNAGSPSNLINNFFQNFDATKKEVKEKRENLNSLLIEFQQKFSKETLKDLTLEKYAFGNGDNDSFCYWLEYALYELGLYSGFAGKFLIYWKKETSSYLKSSFIKNNSDEEAMSLLAEQISNIANNIKLEEALSKLGNGFILKIIYSYNPDLYFPINSVKSIDNALRLLGYENKNLNPIEKSKKLQELFLEKKKEFNTDVTNIEFMDFLFTNFNMKGNISIQKDEVVNEGSYKIIQFHPAYSYEDFVRGIVVKMNENNQPIYEVENKILAEFAQSAIDNQSANYVLIIDEINRANLPAVLGELIYALEYRFDSHNENETTVESIYSIKENEDDIIGNRKLKLPKNLYIIGTMNTADRSVGHIDYAIRRRFAFVDVLPEIEPVHPLVKEVFKKVSELFIEKIEDFTPYKPIKSNKETLASDFRPEDVWIGHSYFICKKENSSDDLPDAEAKPILKNKIKYEVLPILKEYIKDGILLENEFTNRVLNDIISWN